MVFKVKQSPEEKKVIELISFMVHKHYCANDIEAVIEYLDEDIVWIGAGDHEYAVGKEVIDIFRKFAGQIPKCNISEEEYHVLTITPEVYLCSGRMWVVTDSSIQIRTKEMHTIAEYGIAAHWKYKEGNTSQKQSNIEGKLRCCHIHVSNPYDEMVEDDIGFPVKMAQQSYQYLQERVAEQKKKIAEQTQELKRLSYEDSLTGLYNRNKFNQDLNIEQGPNQFGIGAACFDLNGLKEVNDRNGHRAGDILICRAAECLKKGFEGKAYRIGGDEFVVIDNTLAEDDFKAAVYAVQKTMEHDGISCSVGISWRNSQYNIREQIDEADRFMYEQKREFYCQRQHDRRKYR